MKARRVKKLDPDASFRENAERMVRVRIAEVWSFGGRALDPAEQEALHDMRIAAKRLRYLFEITEPCFGAPAKAGAKMARGLQDLLGEIHDCDVTGPRVQAHLERLRAQDVLNTVERVDEDAQDLDPALVRAAGNAARYRGLEALATFLEARRRVLHREFVRHWTEIEETGTRDRLESELAES